MYANLDCPSQKGGTTRGMGWDQPLAAGEHIPLDPAVPSLMPLTWTGACYEDNYEHAVGSALARLGVCSC